MKSPAVPRPSSRPCSRVCPLLGVDQKPGYPTLEYENPATSKILYLLTVEMNIEVALSQLVHEFFLGPDGGAIFYNW